MSDKGTERRTDDGGPAFPVVFEHTDGRNVRTTQEWGGMFLRDYFAAKALAGLLAAESDAEGHGAFRVEIDNPKPRLHHKAANFATVAYELADAMIEARDK